MTKFAPLHPLFSATAGKLFYLACAALSLLALNNPCTLRAQAQDDAPAPVLAAPQADPGVPQDSELQNLDAELSGTVGPGWQLNYRSARAQAAAENKDLILLFTGSDWIDICKRLDTEILNTETFFVPVSEHFVAVRCDFPKAIEQTDAMRAQNQLLMASYRVQGFPTLLLTDATGRPYGVNGYQAVSAKEYATILEAMRAVKARRDEKFAAAKDATGLDKAKLLAEGIPPLPGNLAAWFYRPELEALIANDLQNQTGKAVQFQRLINDVDYSKTMAQLSRNVEWAKMVSLTDDYIRGNQLKGEELQHAMMNKAGVLNQQGKTPAMVQVLLEVVAIDPATATAQRAQEMLDRMRIEKLQQDQRLTPGSGTGKTEAEPEVKP